jgi:hypothetical protein
MKNILNKMSIAAALVAGIYLANPVAVLGQNRVRAGIKGGFNASTLYYENAKNNDRKERYGFHGGVYAQIPAGQFFAIQPELLYSAKGASANYNALGLQGRNTFRLNYLELPVLATFKLGNAVEIQAGPYVSYLLNTNVTSTGDIANGTTTLNRDNFNRTDYGIAGGFNLYAGKALIGLRYAQGLKNIADGGVAGTILGNAKNGVGMISVGFSLN